MLTVNLIDLFSNRPLNTDEAAIATGKRDLQLHFHHV